MFDYIKSKEEKNTSFTNKIDKKGSQSTESEKETKTTFIQPISIDDVTFSTTYVKSQKQRLKLSKKLLQLYNTKYLQKCELKNLCVEIVGKKYFNKIVKTKQKKYNHRKSQENFSLRYQQLLQQIYGNPVLMKHLWSIDFCKLKVLNLSGHNLNSIEGITFMQVPNLVCLELHSNQLINVDCLSKLYLPQLTILTLYENKVRHADKLNRAKMPKLKHIQFDKEEDSQQMIQNITFIVKMQQTNFQKIYAQDQVRILSKKLFKKLEQFFIKKQNFRLNLNTRIWKREVFFQPFWTLQKFTD